MNTKIDCSVLTPDGVIFEGEVDIAVVPSYDGEIGFMYNHAPLVAELAIGEVRFRTGENLKYLVVDGGFVEMKDNKLIILAEKAVKKEELLKDEIELQLKELKNIYKTKEYDERIKLDVEIKKLNTRLKVALK